MIWNIIILLNGISYGLLLFMLSAGLSLILSLMGILNFAHASFYMLGAYAAYSISIKFGFWSALIFSPLIIGLLGAVFEKYLLRKTAEQNHLNELLITFGLSYVILEAVQLIWGRLPVDFIPPIILQSHAFTLYQEAGQGVNIEFGSNLPAQCALNDSFCMSFPSTRVFMGFIALLMLIFLYILMTYTRAGLIIKASKTNPKMVQALGHNVPLIRMWVFSAGVALAALAGVLGGSTFITEPAMAHTLGTMVFVVIVLGGMGSIFGAFFAALFLGILQTIAASTSINLLNINISQIAPILPYLLLIIMLAIKPSGFGGVRVNRV